MSQVDDDWVRHFAVAVRHAARQFYAVRSCVETTRVGVEVARYHGRRLTPLAVQVGVFTRDAWETSGAGGWSVGAAATGRLDPTAHGGTGGWDGHLVGHLDGRWLCDLSGDQFNRPGKGIVVADPLVIPARSEQLSAGLAVEADGLVYSYRVVDDGAWRRFPAWTARPGVARQAAALAIRSLARVNGDRAAAWPDALMGGRRAATTALSG